MNAHDIELPPEFQSGNSVPVSQATIKRERMEEILRAAIEPYKQRISELEAQLEAVGAGGVSAGQRLMTREAVGLQAPSVALLLKIKTYTAACVERLGQPEIDRRWADICSAARDYAAEQVELDRQRRGEPVAWRYLTPTGWHATTDAARALAVAEHHTVEPLFTNPQPTEPVRMSSDDERAAQGLPPYSPRHLTEEEWSRLAENGRRAWGNHPAVPEKEPPCDT